MFILYIIPPGIIDQDSYININDVFRKQRKSLKRENFLILAKKLKLSKFI